MRRIWNSGLTLLEMVSVVALLAILGWASLSIVAGSDEARVDAASHELASALRYARDRSLQTGVLHGALIDEAAERVRLFRIDFSVLPAVPAYDVLHPLVVRPWDVDFDDHAIATGVDLSRSLTFRAPCSDEGWVVFMQDGQVVCGGDPTASLDVASYKLARGDASRTVLLDGMTGRVSIP